MQTNEDLINNLTNVCVDQSGASDRIQYSCSEEEMCLLFHCGRLIAADHLTAQVLCHKSIAGQKWISISL